MIEWRLVKKYGKTFAEARYTSENWSGWYFPISDEKKVNYIWENTIGVYRRNTSI